MAKSVYKSKSEISHEAWIQWMELVPRETRSRIANIIRSVDLSKPDGFVRLSQELMAEVLEGHIPQSVSSDLREWAAVVADHLQSSVKDRPSGLAGQINMLIDARSNVDPLEGLPNYDKALEAIEAKPAKGRRTK